MDANSCFIFSTVVFKFYQKHVTNRLNRKIKNKKGTKSSSKKKND